MKKWLIIRTLFYITFIINIFFRYIDDLRNLIIFLFLLLFAIANDYFRLKGKLGDSSKKYYISTVISIAIGGILKFFASGYMEFYLYVLLAEIPWILNKKAVVGLYILDIFTIFSSTFLRLYLREGMSPMALIQEDYMALMLNILLIYFISVSTFSYVALVVERNKVLKLNEEIEELTITKERNRIAQEIHDDLGHKLVALSMNLDVMSNLIDKDVNKTKELLKKCQILTKDSMNSLRKAVYTLKERNLSQGLENAIVSLIDNIDNASNISIEYHVDDKVESMSFEKKTILYAIIREGLTNSIKHSKCSQINIDLQVKDKICLRIKDNGIGCSNFIKGNGLKGIEERINNINGSIEYITEEGKGFEILAILPM